MFNMFSKPISRIRGMGSAMRTAYSGALGGRSVMDPILEGVIKNQGKMAVAGWGGAAIGAGIGYSKSDKHPVAGALAGGLLGNLAGTVGSIGWQHRGALKGIGKAGFSALRGA